MDPKLALLISVVGALLNALLSATVPCLIKKSDLPLLVNVRTVFAANRQVIVTSSVLVGVIIFISLNVAPDVEKVILGTKVLSPGQLKYISLLNLE